VVQGQPDVVVDFTFSRGLLHIDLTNIGDSPALDVVVAFDQELWGVGGRRLVSEISLFRHTAFMVPQKSISTFLDSSASYFRRGQPLDVTATVTFKDRAGKGYRNVIKHDLRIYRDIGYTRPPT
jgi:hypothetical protein